MILLNARVSLNLSPEYILEVREFGPIRGVVV